MNIQQLNTISRLNARRKEAKNENKYYILDDYAKFSKY
jgi:hypothetical protein